MNDEKIGSVALYSDSELEHIIDACQRELNKRANSTMTFKGILISGVQKKPSLCIKLGPFTPTHDYNTVVRRVWDTLGGKGAKTVFYAPSSAYAKVTFENIEQAEGAYKRLKSTFSLAEYE